MASRKFITGVALIRPAIKGDPHLRIPKDFYETIGDLDAFIVYGVLKSGRGPEHNWNAGSVKADIDKRFCGEDKRGVGRDRVEKALALLKREGWIRYIDRIEPNGQQRGTVIEVHYERLPEALRRKNRKIRYRADGKFTMHEHDGTVVPPKDYATKPSTSKTDDSAGATKSTKGVDSRAKQSQPNPRNPGERSPGERVSVEQYKGDIVEESPSPLSGKGDFDFLFDRDDEPGEKPVEPTGDPLPPEPALSQPGEPVPVSPAPAPAPAPSASFDVDVQALWQMAEAIGDDADRRYKYEAFLSAHVFPCLVAPPVREKWPRTEALAWCQTSAMGQLFLSLSQDSDWTPELARRFIKNSGTFTPDSMRAILLSGRKPGKWGTLKELLNTSPSRARDPEDKIVNHWKALNEWAVDKLQLVKWDLETTLKKFSAHENDPALITSAAQVRKMLLNDESCHDLEGSLFLAVQSFRAALRSADLSSHLRDPAFVARRDEQRPALERAFASDLPFLTVARSIPNCARVIWGLDGARLFVLRLQTGQKLKRRAEIHGITRDADFLITTTTDRCRRIISQMPFDETASRLSQGEEWMKKHFPE